MKKSSNDIYEYFIRLYDEDEFEAIMRTSNSTQRFELLLNYACNAVHSWRDLFKLCEDYPLLRLKTDIIAQLKIDTLPLIETAQNFQTLHSHLSNYFDRLSVLTDKAERELKRLEHKDESVLEWLEEAESYDEFMSEFDCGFLEGTASYFKAQKQYALEKINEWYLELKEELTDSDNKEEYGVLKCRKMLQEVKKLKNTYTSLINEATEENAFEIAVFDFSTFSSKLQNEIENFDEDDDDDEDDEDEDDKEERREERIERLTVVAGAVANGAGVAAKTTGKIIWKIISFPFVLIGKFFKFLFCTKFGRFLLALIILAGAGIAVWQTKIYEPVVDWVTGIFSPDDNNTIKYGDYILELNEDDTYTIKEYKKFSVLRFDEEIPSTYNGKAITTIGEKAFKNCLSLTNLIIPNSITTIEDYAFDGCGDMLSISISESVISIGNYAFRGCHSLQRLYIPNNVIKVGQSLFQNSGVQIYCEVENKPSGWDNNWNYNSSLVDRYNNVVWGYQKES